MFKGFFHWLWYGYQPDEYVTEKTLWHIRYGEGKKQNVE